MAPVICTQYVLWTCLCNPQGKLYRWSSLVFLRQARDAGQQATECSVQVEPFSHETRLVPSMHSASTEFMPVRQHVPFSTTDMAESYGDSSLIVTYSQLL